MPQPLETKQFFADVARYSKHMPQTTDSTLLVLKGHLLLEELLNKLITQYLVKPAALKDARLETHQKLCLAEALLHNHAHPWVWTALKKLNTIRNHFAHDLEPKGIEDRLADFQNFVEDNRDKSPGLRSVLKGAPLKLALGDLHIQLLILLHHHELRGA
jgi:hypothetical protein